MLCMKWVARDAKRGPLMVNAKAPRCLGGRFFWDRTAQPAAGYGRGIGYEGVASENGK
jgi:hypothetical protein